MVGSTSWGSLVRAQCNEARLVAGDLARDSGLELEPVNPLRVRTSRIFSPEPSTVVSLPDVRGAPTRVREQAQLGKWMMRVDIALKYSGASRHDRHDARTQPLAGGEHARLSEGSRLSACVVSLGPEPVRSNSAPWPVLTPSLARQWERLTGSTHAASLVSDRHLPMLG